MDQIGQILIRIKEILLHLGFKETVITNEYRSETNYVYKNLYCIPGYVEGLGFIIEYADSFEEAQKHFHDDGDVFPLVLGEDAILAGLEQEVQRIIGR
jgi:hypothetical protein